MTDVLTVTWPAAERRWPHLVDACRRRGETEGLDELERLAEAQEHLPHQRV